MPYSKGTDSDVINLRATILLSYGYVVLYCPTEHVVQRLEQTVMPFLRQYMNNFKVNLCYLYTGLYPEKGKFGVVLFEKVLSMSEEYFFRALEGPGFNFYKLSHF